MKSCPNCNVELDDKYAFCPQCGSNLLEVIESNFCPYCGKRIETDGEFCPYCGNSMTDEQKIVATSSVTVQQYNSISSNQYDSCNNMKTNYHQTAVEESAERKEKSKFAAIIKWIFYIIGGFFLLGVAKILTKGMVKSYVREGFSISLVVAGAIVAIIFYYILYGNKRE